MKSKVIGVISIKGGVGKTTTVVNLGNVLATEFDKRVLIVDANFSAPNLGLHLGIVKPKHTLHDVMNNKVNIKEAVIEHDGVDILPGSLMGKKVKPFDLKKKLKDIKKYYDVIVLDSSPTVNDEILATMVAADQLLVVTTPDYPTLSCTMHAAKVAKKRRTPITGLILNKVRKKNFELSLHDIEGTTDVPVLAVLPDDVKLLESLAITTAAAQHTPMSEAVIEYKKLASSLIGEGYKDPRWLSKLKGLFTRDVPKQEINRELIRNKLQK